jgi:hypothetical protein
MYVGAGEKADEAYVTEYEKSPYSDEEDECDREGGEAGQKTKKGKDVRLGLRAHRWAGDHVSTVPACLGAARGCGDSDAQQVGGGGGTGAGGSVEAVVCARK